MAATFVPFFEKSATGENLPQYQFNQYKLSKVTLTPTQSIRHVEKDELKTKVVSDLRNALTLSLPPDAIQQIVADLAKYRVSNAVRDDGLPSDAETSTSVISAGHGEKPTVKLQKEGDRVTHIVVECECGQVITMDCVY